MINFFFKSYLHFSNKFNKEIKPTFVFGFILFSSINFFDAISNENYFFLQIQKYF